MANEGAQLVVEPNPYWHGGDIPFERVSFIFGAEEAGQALAARALRISWRCHLRSRMPPLRA